MPHIALLGDSIFDNKAYVGSEPDVLGHLRRMAPDGWEFDLLAVDGAGDPRAVGEDQRGGAVDLVLAAEGDVAVQGRGGARRSVRTRGAARG